MPAASPGSIEERTLSSGSLPCSRRRIAGTDPGRRHAMRRTCFPWAAHLSARDPDGRSTSLATGWFAVTDWKFWRGCGTGSRSRAADKPRCEYPATGDSLHRCREKCFSAAPLRATPYVTEAASFCIALLPVCNRGSTTLELFALALNEDCLRGRKLSSAKSLRVVSFVWNSRNAVDCLGKLGRNSEFAHCCVQMKAKQKARPKPCL